MERPSPRLIVKALGLSRCCYSGMMDPVGGEPCRRQDIWSCESEMVIGTLTHSLASCSPPRCHEVDRPPSTCVCSMMPTVTTGQQQQSQITVWTKLLLPLNCLTRVCFHSDGKHTIPFTALGPALSSWIRAAMNFHECENSYSFVSHKDSAVLIYSQGLLFDILPFSALNHHLYLWVTWYQI